MSAGIVSRIVFLCPKCVTMFYNLCCVVFHILTTTSKMNVMENITPIYKITTEENNLTIIYTLNFHSAVKQKYENEFKKNLFTNSVSSPF